MPQVIWTLPSPSSGMGGVDFRRLSGRRCALVYDDGEDGLVRLLFEGVEAFKCTYHNACTLEMVETYDKLTDLGHTQWLDSVRRQLANSGDGVDSLRHLMIYFDNGPCYEFICRGFRVGEGAAI